MGGLLDGISPPFEPFLAEALLRAFVEQERQFLLGEFRPAVLDGGQFCEAAARILYQIDSGHESTTRPVDECLNYVEKDGDGREHRHPKRDSALQVARVLRSIYKVRSKRGAIHLSPNYTANEMDARLILESSRWVLGEMVRVAWRGRPEELARMVQDLTEYSPPLISVFNEKPLVLRTDISAADEILLVLTWYGAAGASRTEIGAAVMRPSQTVSNNLSKLASGKDRRITVGPTRQYLITQLGIAHLRRSGLLNASVALP